jgi:tripeptide aminopeptidase
MDNELIQQVVEMAVAIQQIPAPTLHERRRAEFLKERFLSEGLEDVEMDDLCNVFARLPGGGDKSPLVLSAHTDTVFPEETDLTVTRKKDTVAGPGIGDNSLGVAGLFGLIWALRRQGISLPGDLWLAANTGEEGMGNLVGMTAVVDRFEDQPLAYIVLEGMALGQIYHHALDVKRYRISVKTKGGHSWVDYGKPSAVHILADLVHQITALTVPYSPRTSLNVGIISGGTSINTIAASAEMALDLRSENKTVLQTLSSQVEDLVKKANRKGVEVKSRLVGQRPSGKISTSHALVRLTYQSLESIGLQPRYNTGSTDANLPLSRGLPAICIGISTGSGAHTLEEYINISPIKSGVTQLVKIVERAFQDL